MKKLHLSHFYLFIYFIILTDLLRIAIEQTKFISNAVLRNGLLYLIWSSIIKEQISSINTLVEKARKAPKDLLCIKQCGMGGKSLVVIQNLYCNDFSFVINILCNNF